MTGPSRARWIGVAVLVLYLVVQIAGLKSSGLTDDDDFYIPAGSQYAAWVVRAAKLDGKAWSRSGIDAAFNNNREHPPIAKYVFGFAQLIFSRWLGPTDGARMGAVFFSTLTALLLFLMSVWQLGAERGARVGALCVLLLLTLPRFFFHSHAATLDVPVACLFVATTVTVLKAERCAWAAWLAGPVFGLAAATKLNAPFFLLAYLPFIVLTRFGLPRSAEDPEESGLPLPSIPLAIVSMAVIGPLVFVISWPWLWFDTVARVSEYVRFHLHHYGIHFLYFGRIFTADPFAPWHAPFLMTAVTVPLATSVLALFGVLAASPRMMLRILDRDAPDSADRREGDFLLLGFLCLVTSISVVAFAGTPIYGGVKLFMPFFPFWCLFAAYGANRLYERLRDELGAALPAGALIVVLACSGAMLQLKYGAYALSEYNGLIGGLRGATAAGLERQYYDIAFRDLVDFVSKEAPNGTKLHFLPNNWEYVRTYKWYRKAGELRQDIQVVRQENRSDWIVITHERRFARYGNDLSRYRGKKIIEEKVIDGTPIWTLLQAR